MFVWKVDYGHSAITQINIVNVDNKKEAMNSISRQINLVQQYLIQVGVRHVKHTRDCIPEQSRSRQASGKLGLIPHPPFNHWQLFATTARGYPHRYRTLHTSPTHYNAIMNAFRVARAARPAFNALRTVQRRGYADVAADKIQLSLALPHQVRSRRLEYGSPRGPRR